MEKQLQLIIPVLFMVSVGLSGYTQNIGGEFIVDGIKYKITSTTPAQVEIVDYDTDFGKEVTIPSTVDLGLGTDYEVTAIGNTAFSNKQLTKVIFNTPSNVTSTTPRMVRTV